MGACERRAERNSFGAIIKDQTGAATRLIMYFFEKLAALRKGLDLWCN